VRRIDAPTFWTLALTVPTGERCLIQFPTPAFAADWEGYDRTAVERTRWVHTTAEQGEPVGALFRAAKDAGTARSLDVEHPFVLREDLPELLGMTDVAFFNASAAEALEGPEAAMRRAAELGAETALVTLGADGCVLLDREGDVHRLPPHDVEPVDTNGAGDAFAGAFIVGRLAGLSDRDAAELATVTAAISTTAVGGHGVTDLGARVRTEAEGRALGWRAQLW
jgi:ribokinase